MNNDRFHGRRTPLQTNLPSDTDQANAAPGMVRTDGMDTGAVTDSSGREVGAQAPSQQSTPRVNFHSYPMRTTPYRMQIAGYTPTASTPSQASQRLPASTQLPAEELLADNHLHCHSCRCKKPQADFLQSAIFNTSVPLHCSACRAPASTALSSTLGAPVSPAPVPTAPIPLGPPRLTPAQPATTSALHPSLRPHVPDTTPQRCPRCHHDKPPAGFRRSPYGHTSRWCIDCLDRARNRREATKARRIAATRIAATPAPAQVVQQPPVIQQAPVVSRPVRAGPELVDAQGRKVCSACFRKKPMEEYEGLWGARTMCCRACRREAKERKEKNRERAGTC